MKIDARFAESMAELRAAESAANPDAALISMCERYEWLADNLRAEYEEIIKQGVVKSNLRPVLEEVFELAVTITDLRPATDWGRMAKAVAALTSLEGREGPHCRMAIEALQHYIVNDATSGVFTSGQKRKFKKSNWR